MAAKKVNFIESGINWIHERTNEKQFLIFSSILVGLSVGIAAVILKLFVSAIRTNVVEGYFLKLDFKYLYLILPLIGIGIHATASGPPLCPYCNKPAESVAAVRAGQCPSPRGPRRCRIILHTCRITVGSRGSICAAHRCRGSTRLVSPRCPLLGQPLANARAFVLDCAPVRGDAGGWARRRGCDSARSTTRTNKSSGKRSSCP